MIYLYQKMKMIKASLVTGCDFVHLICLSRDISYEKI